KPMKVSTVGRNVLPGSGYDIVSTHYVYDDGKVVNAQADWTLQGDYGFTMSFRVNFERGNIVFEDGKLKLNSADGPGMIADLSADMEYYCKIKYQIESIIHNTPIDITSTSSTATTMEIIEAEMRSADNKGDCIVL